MVDKLKPLAGADDLHTSLIGRTCECCGGPDLLAGVASSSLGPVSILWCFLCLTMSADTLLMIESVVESCGGIENVSASLVYFDKDKDSFIDYKTKEIVPIKFNNGSKILTRTEGILKIRELNEGK